MMDLKQASTEILQRLDIAAEYRSWGIKVTGSKPGPKGWIECHAHGRDDKNPSAGINVDGDEKTLGRYRDFAEDRALSFWDAAAEFGGHSDWKAARAHYAERTGVHLTNGREEKKPFLRPTVWVDVTAARFATGMDGVDPECLRPTGAMLAKRGGLNVIAWPVLVGADEPSGWYYKNVLPGKPIANKSSKHKQLLTPGCTPCGWIGASALTMLSAGDARTVLWVEGVPDMLAAESARIREGIEGVAILSSSHGALVLPPNHVLEMLGDVPTYVIGDADKDGQAGVRKKVDQLRHFTATGSWELPYEVEDKHGKDLRDWLNDGHKLAELLEQLPEPMEKDTSPPPASAPQPKIKAKAKKGDKPSEELVEATQDVLAKCQLRVIGTDERGALVLWNQIYARWEVIPNVDRLGINRFVQMVGPAAGSLLTGRPGDDDPRMRFSEFSKGLSMIGSNPLDTEDSRGMGIWGGADEDVLLVTKGWAAHWDGSELLLLDDPVYRGHMLSIGTGEQWADFTEMREYCHLAGDPDWCERVLESCAEMFGEWRWDQDHAPRLLTGLILATFAQDLLPWCPQVVVVGESNSGKSFLLQALVGLFLPLGRKSSHSTEAGLRQAIGDHSRPMLIDEWDSTKNREMILTMMRVACRGDDRFVGTAGQNVLASRIKQVFWAAGITSGLNDQADVNRFLMLKLLTKLPGAPRLVLRDPAELVDLGTKMAAIAVRHAHGAVRRASRIQDAIDRGRASESLSYPAAFLFEAMGMSDEDAAEPLAELVESSVDELEESEEDNTDQTRLIEDIMGCSVESGGSLRQLSVGQVILRADRDQDQRAIEALAREGIVIWDGRDELTDDAKNYGRSRRPYGEKVIAFNYKLIQLKLLRRTNWNKQNLDELLLRVKTARRYLRTRFRSEKRNWVVLNWDFFNEQFGHGAEPNRELWTDPDCDKSD